MPSDTRRRGAGPADRGSGNVFRDLEHESADLEQFKAILSAEIIKALEREGLSVRGAQKRTGIAAADFSRIRNADLARFTVDRLMSILNRLGSLVEVKVRVRPAGTAQRETRA
ncbi:MAG: XRE family transcriptional regulator [Acidobacteria bacterium]|nr:XRE family transcriptional regulator [Acidobacteriota bacterium]